MPGGAGESGCSGRGNSFSGGVSDRKIKNLKKKIKIKIKKILDWIACVMHACMSAWQQW